jgi:hypothetical protein
VGYTIVVSTGVSERQLGASTDGNTITTKYEDTTVSVDEFTEADLQEASRIADELMRSATFGLDREWCLSLATLLMVPALTTLLAAAIWLLQR